LAAKLPKTQQNRRKHRPTGRRAEGVFKNGLKKRNRQGTIIALKGGGTFCWYGGKGTVSAGEETKSREGGKGQKKRPQKKRTGGKHGLCLWVQGGRAGVEKRGRNTEKNKKDR